RGTQVEQRTPTRRYIVVLRLRERQARESLVAVQFETPIPLRVMRAALVVGDVTHDRRAGIGQGPAETNLHASRVHDLLEPLVRSPVIRVLVVGGVEKDLGTPNVSAARYRLVAHHSAIPAVALEIRCSPV